MRPLRVLFFVLSLLFVLFGLALLFVECGGTSTKEDCDPDQTLVCGPQPGGDEGCECVDNEASTEAN